MSKRDENMFRSNNIIQLCENHITHPSIKLKLRFIKRPLPVNPNYETSIDLDCKGTIESILEEYPRYNHILVLNMANATVIGGGWLTGAEAQEEYLFRRTDLHKTLKDCHYPMLCDEVIYSPYVRILFDDDYNFLEQIHCVSVVSVAAVKNPYITQKGGLIDYDWNEMYYKIRMIFHIAVINKHDCLILGALGCGAFHNPPQVIAEIFAEMCAEYSGYFKKIIFAIKSVGGDTNCEIFQQVFMEQFGENSD